MKSRQNHKIDNNFDKLVGFFSPKMAFKRRQFRFAYDALDGHRTRKNRSISTSSGDTDLTEANLDKLREICRDLCKNSPIVKGLLKTESDEICGDTNIQARTSDLEFNAKAEDLWKNEMADTACDVTGRFNFDQFLRKAFLSYRRDGDMAVILGDEWIQAIEGEQVGTPYGKKASTFTITNGVAFSNQTKRVIGYYIGKPSKYGYIDAASYKQYKAEKVHHIFNPDRFSQSRGEPIFTSSIDKLEKLEKYYDAEMVAAVVNACFTMFVESGGTEMMPDPYTGGSSSTGYDDNDNRLEKMEPGSILYGQPGEKATGIGQVRPGALFDPFIMRSLSFIARPLCIPLMLVLLDFSGATFMNARIAYKQAQKNWKSEQKEVIKPFVSRIWNWKMTQWIAAGKLTARDDAFRHEIFCNRWPYVDPYKEAQADKVQLENKTTTRTAICARQGDDFSDVANQRAAEEGLLEDLELVETEKKAS